MHVEVSVSEQRIADRRENARLVPAEIVRENQVQGGTRLRLVLVVPTRIVPTSAVGYLFCGQPEKEQILLTCCFRHLDRGPSRVPMVRAPFSMNFMLLVPLAS